MRQLRKQSECIEQMVSKGNLMTKARRMVAVRNKQLDKGTGRQIWKCLDPLNCVASVAFRKCCTWVQTWTCHFRVPVVAVASSASASDLIAQWSVITQVRMVSKPPNSETCCTKCGQSHIAGVVVCINFRLKTWHVGVVSIYNMLLDSLLICK